MNSNKLSTQAVALLTGYSVEWVRQNIPSQNMDTGNGRRTIRIYDRANVENFMKQREIGKAKKIASKLRNAA